MTLTCRITTKVQENVTINLYLEYLLKMETNCRGQGQGMSEIRALNVNMDKCRKQKCIPRGKLRKASKFTYKKQQLVICLSAITPLVPNHAAPVLSYSTETSCIFLFQFIKTYLILNLQKISWVVLDKRSAAFVCLRIVSIICLL